MVLALMTDERGRPFPDLGDRMKRLRLRSLRSQVEVANRLGVTQGFLSKVEQGLRRPDAAILQVAAELFQADYNELAVAAGYAPEPAGDVLIPVPADQAVAVRRFAALPKALKDLLLDMSDPLVERWREAIEDLRIRALEGPTADQDARAERRQRPREDESNEAGA